MAITQRPRPDVRRKRICVFAGDHGVCAEGVSAYPPAVTSLMVGNFLRGGALERHRETCSTPAGALAAVGGFEIAGLCGRCLGGATAGLPVVVDGFISSAAALTAMRICPAVKDYLFFAHMSAEPGHRVFFEREGLQPLVNLGCASAKAQAPPSPCRSSRTPSPSTTRWPPLPTSGSSPPRRLSDLGLGSVQGLLPTVS